MIPGLGRSPGEGKGYPLQYSGLENSMDYIVHGVAKSRTRLTDFHFDFTVRTGCGLSIKNSPKDASQTLLSQLLRFSQYMEFMNNSSA